MTPERAGDPGPADASREAATHAGSFSGRLSDALKGTDGGAPTRPGEDNPHGAGAGPAPGGQLTTRVNKAFTRPSGVGPASAALPAGDPAEQDSFSGRLADHLESVDSPAPDPEPLTAEETPVSHGPVGTGAYVVRPGDCMSSIAAEHGHFWETLWDDPGNAELRQVRRDPNLLREGDRVTVPPLRQKSETGAPEMRHRFRKKGQPETLRLRILEDDKPRANEPYVLDVDGEQTIGTTDADGQVVRAIKPTARRATLRVGQGTAATEYVFQLGDLDPLSELSGVQARLNSLGFACGPVDGVWGPRTRRAVESFQAHYRIPVTGQVDEATRQRLHEAYGC